MKKLSFKNISLLISACFVAALSACSPNVGLQKYNIDQAMTGMPADIKQQIGDFKFYFGKGSAPMMAKKLGKVRTVKRTNAWGKSAQKSCNWAFYSALIELRAQAVAAGGNGVANIQSNWKNVQFDSKTQFEGDNTFNMSGVALIGEAIKQ